jgi:hypothetical protein
MAEYALVFTFRDVVSGEGFLAGIEITGRALMVQEDQDWWMLGVRPPGLMAKAQTPAGAYLEFRNSHKAVLFDAAASANGFDGFKAEVERFFDERDEKEEKRWEAAAEKAHEGSGTLEALFEGVKREEPSARPVSARVERLDQNQRFTPNQNVLDSYALGTAPSGGSSVAPR